jgi:hypothetical protein
MGDGGRRCPGRGPGHLPGRGRGAGEPPTGLELPLGERHQLRRSQAQCGGEVEERGEPWVLVPTFELAEVLRADTGIQSKRFLAQIARSARLPQRSAKSKDVAAASHNPEILGPF